MLEGQTRGGGPVYTTTPSGDSMGSGHSFIKTTTFPKHYGKLSLNPHISNGSNSFFKNGKANAIIPWTLRTYIHDDELLVRLPDLKTQPVHWQQQRAVFIPKVSSSKSLNDLRPINSEETMVQTHSNRRVGEIQSTSYGKLSTDRIEAVAHKT